MELAKIYLVYLLYQQTSKKLWQNWITQSKAERVRDLNNRQEIKGWKL